MALLEASPASRAMALAVLAKCLLAQGRATEALASARAAIDLVALGGVEEGEALARLALARALHALGKPEALGVIAEARDAILRRAGDIVDPALRRSFLERVPENATTLALATEWLGA